MNNERKQNNLNVGDFDQGMFVCKSLPKLS